MSDISFLASILLKVVRSEQVSAEDIQSLQALSGIVPVPEPEPIHEEPEPVHEEPEPIHEEPEPVPALESVPVHEEAATEAAKEAEPVKPAKPIKKLKTLETQTSSQTNQSTQPIDTSYCIARKVDDKTFLPGTDAAKVYPVKQCVRRPIKGEGEVLCSKCKEFQQKWLDGKDAKCKDWKGLLTETPLDVLHVVGSKWYNEKYPCAATVAATAAATATTDATAATVPEPKPESVLLDHIPIKEVQWATLKLDGIHYIYNLKDRRIYRADITQDGEDQILWDKFEGKLKKTNDEIDYYAEETEEEYLG